MYNTTEFFNKNGVNLKDILKETIYNYYKSLQKSKNQLHISNTNGKIEHINKIVLSNREESKNA